MALSSSMPAAISRPMFWKDRESSSTSRGASSSRGSARAKEVGSAMKSSIPFMST